MEKEDNNFKDTYFITGATGFLGSEFVSRLLAQGMYVCLLVRGESDEIAQKRIKLLFESAHEDQITFIRGSLNDIRHLYQDGHFDKKNTSCRTITKMVHLAADLSFRSKDRDNLFNSNTEGTKQIVWLANELQIPLLYISTAYVHGRRSGALPENELRCPTKFNNSYEESKFHAEMYIREKMRTSNLQAVIVRPGIIVSDNYNVQNSSNGFGLYAITEATYFLYKNIFRFIHVHPNISKLMGLHTTTSGSVVSTYLPMIVSNTNIHFVPLEIVINSLLEIEEHINTYMGKSYTLVPPNPISMKEITTVTLLASNIQMPVIIFPKIMVLLFFRLIRYMSYPLPFLTKLSKRFHSYEYYLTNTYQFDIHNSSELYKKIDTTVFDNQDNYFLEGAKSFIHYLDLTKNDL